MAYSDQSGGPGRRSNHRVASSRFTTVHCSGTRGKIENQYSSLDMTINLDYVLSCSLLPLSEGCQELMHYVRLCHIKNNLKIS